MFCSRVGFTTKGFSRLAERYAAAVIPSRGA